MSTKKEKKEKMTIEKIFESVMMSSRDNNIRFSDLQKLLIALGFHLRIKGDHFIYTDGNRTVSINYRINKMVALRLIKENNLDTSVLKRVKKMRNKNG